MDLGGRAPRRMSVASLARAPGTRLLLPRKAQTGDVPRFACAVPKYIALIFFFGSLHLPLKQHARRFGPLFCASKCVCRALLDLLMGIGSIYGLDQDRTYPG